MGLDLLAFYPKSVLLPNCVHMTTFRLTHHACSVIKLVTSHFALSLMILLFNITPSPTSNILLTVFLNCSTSKHVLNALPSLALLSTMTALAVLSLYPIPRTFLTSLFA